MHFFCLWTYIIAESKLFIHTVWQIKFLLSEEVWSFCFPGRCFVISRKNTTAAYLHNIILLTQLMKIIAQNIIWELRSKLQSFELWQLLCNQLKDFIKTRREIVNIASVSNMRQKWNSDLLAAYWMNSVLTEQHRQWTNSWSSSVIWDQYPIFTYVYVRRQVNRKSIHSYESLRDIQCACKTPQRLS